MPRKPPAKNRDELLSVDSDANFAFIAGYTEGGCPYGIAREEQGEIEVVTAQAEVKQLRPVPLLELVQEMECHSDLMTVYFRISTGEFVTVTEEHLRIAEAEGSFENRAEWEQDAIRLAAELIDNEDDFIPLPSQYDIHEYSIMEEFCYTQEKPEIKIELLRAISGKGAFRRFREAICHYAIEKTWYKFKTEAYRIIARNWCEEHGLSWSD